MDVVRRLNGLERGVVAVAALLPLLVIVILSAPAWVMWPFVSVGRQRATLRLLDALRSWATAVVEGVCAPPSRLHTTSKRMGSEGDHSRVFGRIKPPC